MMKNVAGCIILMMLMSSRFSFAQVVDKESIVAKGATVELLGEGYAFTEGPAADKEGNVYFTDQPNNKIIRWAAATGELKIFSDNAGRSNGMYFDQNGSLISCADKENQLWHWDSLGAAEVIIEDFNEKPLNGPNDLWIAPNGAIYFTDPLYKRDYWERDPKMQQKGEYVYYLSPDRSQLKVVERTLTKPNGIVGSPDGKKLYIADIGSNATFAYDIKSDGEISDKTLFTSLGSDGMTIDSEGNVYLTGKGVTVFNTQGQQIAHIPINKDWTANVCFGGKDKNLLFITAMDAVYGLKMNVTGVD